MKPTTSSANTQRQNPVYHRSIPIGGIDIFYRESGPTDAPAILLLHGFPTSSNMFRNLIPKLATSFHVIAPDFPGFGQSSAPARQDYSYTLENITNIVEQLIEKLGLRK